MNLCKEVVDGIRIMFDTYLGPILLYKPEVTQFKKLSTYYKPVLPKKVLFPGPVIMPSRLRSQSRVSTGAAPGVSGFVDGGAHADYGSETAAAGGTSTMPSSKETHSTSTRSNDDFMSETESSHSDAKEREKTPKEEADGNVEEEEEEGTAIADSSSTATTRQKLELTDADDKENDASFVEGGAERGGSGRGGGEEVDEERLSRGGHEGAGGNSNSSNDGGSTEAGSSSARVGHLGRAYLASSRDRLTDGFIDTIENWRLVSQETIQKSPNNPSLLYGAHHFLRLFVHLPKLLSLLTDINAVKLNAILFHVEGILNYIDDNAEFFLVEDFANSALVVEELNANCARNKLH